MKKVSLSEFKEILKKFPAFRQKQILQQQLEIVKDERIKLELLRIFASLPPTESKEIKHAEVADESWKKIGSLIKNIQIEAKKEDDTLERFALEKKEQPTLEDFVSEEPVKKKDESLEIKYERSKDTYEPGQEYKPAKLEPAKSPGSFEPMQKTFKTGAEEVRESSKTTSRKELEETEKYKR